MFNVRVGVTRNKTPGLLLFGLLIAVDLILKTFYASKGMVVLNRGGVFGLFPSPWWYLVLVVVWLVIVFEWQKLEGGKWWGMGLIAAGGAANIIDRIFFGAVRDFIYYPLINVYGNLADIMLTFGVVGLLVVSYWRQKRKIN